MSGHNNTPNAFLIGQSSCEVTKLSMLLQYSCSLSLAHSVENNSFIYSPGSIRRTIICVKGGGSYG